MAATIASTSSEPTVSVGDAAKNAEYEQTMLEVATILGVDAADCRVLRVKNGRPTGFHPITPSAARSIKSVPELSTRPAGRAPRLASNGRSKGSRRGSTTRTSSRGGDSGDSDSDEPADGRLHEDVIECAARGCRNRFPRRGPKRFCSTACGARDRQDRRRYGDLTDRERDELADAFITHYAGDDAFAPWAVERDANGTIRIHSQTFLTSGGAHARLAHPSLRLRFEPWSRPASLVGASPAVEGAPDHEREALTFALRCRCNGSHIDGGVVGCFRCGRSREGAID